MKKTIILTSIFIIIPTIIITCFYENKQLQTIQLKYFNNITIRVKRLKSDTIQTLPLEEYVVGVLAGEIPTYFHMEAIKAQAVASRTYALKRIEYNKDKEYDVVDSTLNQVYLDDDYLKSVWKEKYQTNINNFRTAVNETSGVYLDYQGDVIDALFFSTSNGYTEDSVLVFGFDVPYLQSVESTWDEDTSEAFTASTTLSLQEFYNKLNLPFNDTLSINITKRSETNRIITLIINNQEFSGRQVYNALKIKSTDFTIYQENDKVIIKTKGYGHGVGMSQYGALGMAKQGYNYQQILNHYYQGTTLKNL
ncbi:MAG: stage II sporulation protein D [bacterium]|nr:stage II sporulation protein D [bacterium]